MKRYKMALVMCCMAVLVWAAHGAAQAATEFFPLRVGNSWLYTGEGLQLRMTVQEQAEGRFLLVSEVNGFVIQREYYMVDGDDVIAVRREFPQGSFDLVPPQVFLKAPLAPGNQWTWDGEVAGQHTRMTFSVLEPESVETPAGTFEAVPLVVEGVVEGEELFLMRWFAPGVGMIREQAQLTQGSQSVLVDMRLAEYQVQ